MLFSRNIVSTLKSPLAANKIVKRTVVCTPPRNRVSLAEKLTHGFVIAAGIMATPLYISANLKHYRGVVEE